MILDYTQKLEAADAFNFIRSETCKIIETMKPPYKVEVSLALRVHLVRKSRKLFRESYLKAINVNKDFKEEVYIQGDMYEVRFAIEQRGICAVNVVKEQ